MKPKTPFLRGTSALILTIALAACAAQTPTHSGFLQDYQGIKHHEGDKNHLESWSELPRWTGYNEVVLDPVVLHLPETTLVNLSTDDKALLKAQATAALSEAFRPKIRTAPNAGPSAQLRVRAAVTGIDLSNPAINVVSSLTLIAPLDNGGVTVEIEVIDAQTQKVMHRRVVAMNGKVYWLLDSFERTGHARIALGKIFDNLAADLAKKCGCQLIQSSSTRAAISS